MRSIFTVSFSHRETRFYREIQGGSDYKASIALAYYMRTHGVYMPELHFLALSDAHMPADLEQVCEAFRQSLTEMKRDGFFVDSNPACATRTRPITPWPYAMRRGWSGGGGW